MIVRWWRPRWPSDHIADKSAMSGAFLSLTSRFCEKLPIKCCATIKTPRPATIWHTSDGGAAFGGQAGVKPEAARGGGPKGQALHQLDGRTS